MPICPNCNKEIDHFDYNACVDEYGTVNIFTDNRGDRSYLNWNREGNDNGGTQFKCPECSEELFIDESKAKEFLLRNSKTGIISSGIFFCERHQIGFDESCNKCLEEELKVVEQKKGWNV
mgnify:FL=1